MQVLLKSDKTGTSHDGCVLL